MLCGGMNLTVISFFYYLWHIPDNDKLKFKGVEKYQYFLVIQQDKRNFFIISRVSHWYII